MLKWESRIQYRKTNIFMCVSVSPHLFYYFLLLSMSFMLNILLSTFNELHSRRVILLNLVFKLTPTKLQISICASQLKINVGKYSYHY